MWQSWKNSPRHSSTSHFLHLLLTLVFISHIEQDQQHTAEVYFTPLTCFCETKGLPRGQHGWGRFPTLSVNFHTKESPNLWIILFPHGDCSVAFPCCWVLLLCKSLISSLPDHWTCQALEENKLWMFSFCPCLIKCPVVTLVIVISALTHVLLFPKYKVMSDVCIHSYHIIYTIFKNVCLLGRHCLKFTLPLVSTLTSSTQMFNKGVIFWE